MKNYYDNPTLRELVVQKQLSLQKAVEDLHDNVLMIDPESQNNGSRLLNECIWETDAILENLMDEAFEEMISSVVHIVYDLNETSEEDIVKLLLNKPHYIKFIADPTEAMNNAVNMSKL